MTEKCKESVKNMATNRQLPDGYWTRQHVDNSLMGISDLERVLDVLTEMSLDAESMRMIAKGQAAVRNIKTELMNAQFNLRK